MSVGVLQFIPSSSQILVSSGGLMMHAAGRQVSVGVAPHVGRASADLDVQVDQLLLAAQLEADMAARLLRSDQVDSGINHL